MHRSLSYSFIILAVLINGHKVNGAFDSPCMVISGAAQSRLDEQRALLPIMPLQPGKPIIFNTMSSPSMTTGAYTRPHSEPLLYILNEHRPSSSAAFFMLAYYKLCTKLLCDEILVSPHAYYYPSGEIKVHINKFLLSYNAFSNKLSYVDGSEPTPGELLQKIETPAYYTSPTIIFNGNAVHELSLNYTHGMHLLQEIYRKLHAMDVINIRQPDTIVYTHEHPQCTSFMYDTYHFLHRRDAGTIIFFDEKSDCSLTVDRATFNAFFQAPHTFTTSNDFIVSILRRKIEQRIYNIAKKSAVLKDDITITWDNPFATITTRDNKECWYSVATKQFKCRDLTGPAKSMSINQIFRMLVKDQKIKVTR